MKPGARGIERADVGLVLDRQALEGPLIPRGLADIEGPDLHQIARTEIRQRQPVAAGRLIDRHGSDAEARHGGRRVGEGHHAAKLTVVADMRFFARRLGGRHDVSGCRGDAPLAREDAGLVGVVRGELQPQFIGNERQVDGARQVVAGAAVIDVEALDIDGARGCLGIRGLGDHPHGAAHGGGAEQRALRAAQHLDALQVEHPRIERQWHRRVVDVETGGRLAIAKPASGDAANGDGSAVRHAEIAAGAERQIGNGVSVVAEVDVAEFLQGLAGDGGDAQRYLLNALAAPLGRDDDRFQRRLRRGGRVAGGRCSQGRTHGSGQQRDLSRCKAHGRFVMHRSIPSLSVSRGSVIY